MTVEAVSNLMWGIPIDFYVAMNLDGISTLNDMMGGIITPHTFRNNFAKWCLMAGMDIYTLSHILGHSSVKITVERIAEPP